MLNIALTAILLSIPYFIPYPENGPLGLRTGLWISLCFFGRLHPVFTLLVFTIAVLQSAVKREPASSRSYEKHTKKPSSPQFIIFLSSMMMFCALAQVVPAYGEAMHLDQNVLDTANIAGLAAALIGPLLFGRLCDEKGPFPAVIFLILMAASSIGITAYGGISSIWFIAGAGLNWLTVSGTFTMIPVLMMIYYGRKQLPRYAPAIILLLISLWAFIYYAVTAAQPVLHAANLLMFAVCLILVAALFCFLAWENRLSVID